MQWVVFLALQPLTDHWGKKKLIERNTKKHTKLREKLPFEVHGGFALGHGAWAWAVPGFPRLAKGTGWFCRASFQVSLPWACKVSIGDTSKQQHLSMLPSLSPQQGRCGSPGWDHRYPHFTPSTCVSGMGWDHRRDCPPASQSSCKCSTSSTQKRGRAESEVLAQCLH